MVHTAALAVCMSVLWVPMAIVAEVGGYYTLSTLHVQSLSVLQALLLAREGPRTLVLGKTLTQYLLAMQVKDLLSYAPCAAARSLLSLRVTGRLLLASS